VCRAGHGEEIVPVSRSVGELFVGVMLDLMVLVANSSGRDVVLVVVMSMFA
jgi:hypothetical protein